MDRSLRSRYDLFKRLRTIYLEVRRAVKRAQNYELTFGSTYRCTALENKERKRAREEKTGEWKRQKKLMKKKQRESQHSGGKPCEGERARKICRGKTRVKKGKKREQRESYRKKRQRRKTHTRRRAKYSLQTRRAKCFIFYLRLMANLKSEINVDWRTPPMSAFATNERVPFVPNAGAASA